MVAKKQNGKNAEKLIYSFVFYIIRLGVL